MRESVSAGALRALSGLFPSAHGKKIDVGRKAQLAPENRVEEENSIWVDNQWFISWNCAFSVGVSSSLHHPDVCQMERTRLFIFHGHDDLCLRTSFFRHLCLFWFILLSESL